MNEIQVLGRLAAEPEYKALKGGNCVATFDIADNTYFQGESQTFFFRVETYGHSAEYARKYLHKGTNILVFGMLVIRSFIPKGTQKKLHLYSIVAREIKGVSGDVRVPTGGVAETREAMAAKEKEQQEEDVPDYPENLDDCPF